MSAIRPAFVLKFLIWVLYIIGNALSLFWIYPTWRETGLDIWTIVYIPIEIAYLVGGLYVVLNFDKVFPRYRARVIQILCALFAIDIFYSIITAIASVRYPNSFNPPLEPATGGQVVAGSGVGLGISLLILFVMIRLVNAVSGATGKKPPVWMTAFGWIIVLAVLALVVAYSQGIA